MVAGIFSTGVWVRVVMCWCGMPCVWGVKSRKEWERGETEKEMKMEERSEIFREEKKGQEQQKVCK